MDKEIDILKMLVNEGAFGAVNYVATKCENDIDKGTQFASVINFLILTVNDGTKNVDIPVVIKKKYTSEEAKNLFNSDVSFNNEVLMYTKILPMLKADRIHLFPKLYCRKSTEIANDYKDVLIFENLQHFGYMVTKENVFIDCNHIKMALIKLGEFHGLSYLAKRNYKDNFFDTVNGLIETKFANDDTDPVHKEIMISCFERGIKPLIEQNKDIEILNQVLNKLKTVGKTAKLLVKPEEPFAVVCHGDFCRNNMFFRYDNNKPIDIKFFDLQNALYTSPAIDISFFLYMNTTAEMRDKHWDDFLNTYWLSFKNTVPDLEFTFAQFMEHFSKRAIYGYFPTCFFLPMSVEEESRLSVEEIVALSFEERKKQMLKYGGEAGTKLISEIVEHLLNKRYLHKFLEL